MPRPSAPLLGTLRQCRRARALRGDERQQRELLLSASRADQHQPLLGPRESDVRSEGESDEDSKATNGAFRASLRTEQGLYERSISGIATSGVTFSGWELERHSSYSSLKIQNPFFCGGTPFHVGIVLRVDGHAAALA